jgi:hypothetical protein
MTRKFSMADDLNWERQKKYKITLPNESWLLCFCTLTEAKAMKDMVKVEEIGSDGSSKEV